LSQPIRVILFEDTKALRESMELLIGSAPGFELQASYDNGWVDMDAIESFNPDVILMDIEMPKANGINATGVIKAHFPAINILMQTVFEDDEKVFDALCAGASGYLLKNASPDKVLDAIREIKEGGSPMSPAIARKIISLFNRHNLLKINELSKFNQNSNKQINVSQLSALTDRETDVLNGLMLGKSYKMIAADLNLSYGTVHTHMKSIYRKLHVNSMSEAVLKGIELRQQQQGK
jgi:DNA-binding NarL/FixJ family response regulator